MAESMLAHKEQQVLARINRQEVAALLQALIRNPSDHPPGDCRDAMRVVEAKLSREGIDFDIWMLEEHQPNLIARYGSREAGRRLMFHAHIDTVPAGERANWSVDPFAGEVRDGRIYGRGAGDDKGSVAAQVMAAVILARAGVQLNGTLQLAVVSDEESGGLKGTRWLHEIGALATDALVVGEQTANRISVAERVACGIDLTVLGRSAHGAMPWAGENAVLKAASALAWLRQDLFPRLAQRTHPFLPPATLNVGRINGGIQWSIVPEQCKVEMDRRLLPGETREMAMDEIRRSLDAYADQVEPLRYDLFSTGEVAANVDTPPDHPFVRQASQALTALAGEERPLTGYVQTSDGRWFARDGIPIIHFGPSDPSVAHAADEYVSVDQLVEATRFLTLLAMRWLTSKSSA